MYPNTQFDTKFEMYHNYYTLAVEHEVAYGKLANASKLLCGERPSNYLKHLHYMYIKYIYLTYA